MPVINNTLLPLFTSLMLMGCQAHTSDLPKSQKLSADKVAEIAATIERTYPELSTEIRGQLLNTVVKSLDNMVFVEGGEFQMGDFGWPHNFDITNMCDWPCGMVNRPGFSRHSPGSLRNAFQTLPVTADC